MEKIKTTENTIDTQAERELSPALKIEKLEKENEELKNKLEDMEKSFRIIAHDLIGPVGNAAVLTEMLSEGIKDGSMDKEELVESMDALSTNGRATLKLLEDLLTWSRLQQGGAQPEILVTKLSDQVNDSIAPIIQIAKQKDIKLINEVSENVEILADSNMLQTVLRNLSSNSIKFTPNGGNITISSQMKDNKVEIIVKDDGVGLKDEQKIKLFESVGVTSVGTNKEKGTGFGLSICKEIIEKMGGTIRAESEGEGKGTSFIVTLYAVSK